MSLKPPSPEQQTSKPLQSIESFLQNKAKESKYKPNQLSTFLSELIGDAKKDPKHPLHKLVEKYGDHIDNLADVLSIEQPLPPNQDKPLSLPDQALQCFVNQWLAQVFLTELQNNNPSLYNFLTTLATIEKFRESPTAQYLRQLISGAAAHAMLMHAFQQQSETRNLQILSPSQPDPPPDFSTLTPEEIQQLELFQWEKAGVDFAVYDSTTNTLILIDAKSNQGLHIIQIQPISHRQPQHSAYRIAQAIREANPDIENAQVVHLQITVPTPKAFDNDPTLKPLPPTLVKLLLNDIQRLLT